MLHHMPDECTRAAGDETISCQYSQHAMWILGKSLSVKVAGMCFKTYAIYGFYSIIAIKLFFYTLNYRYIHLRMQQSELYNYPREN